jgi:hypothetical protein
VSAWRLRFNALSSTFMTLFAVSLFLTAVSVSAGVLHLR